MKEIGVGDLKDDRLKRTIGMVAAGYGLERLPEPAEVFNRSFFARGTARHVRDLYVAGRQVVRDGEVLRLDLAAAEDELRRRYRASVSASPLLAAWPRYEATLRGWYTDRAGRC